jgi:hypothetical protein
MNIRNISEMCENVMKSAIDRVPLCTAFEGKHLSDIIFHTFHLQKLLLHPDTLAKGLLEETSRYT